MQEINSGLKNFYAVIMGFNKYKDQQRLLELRYAEKDAYDLYTTLIDPNIGNYPEENIKTITGNASQDDIETALYTTIVKNRTPEDSVLVYYSGHGFMAGDSGDVYLGTPNTSITDILNNPRAGLKMEDLFTDYFLETKARNVIFILDCCHSGAFLPQDSGKYDLQKNELLDKSLFTKEGRVAIVSSPRGVDSRENRSFQNGIFTYYLIKGLKGDAIEPNTNLVTISSLASFVQAKAPQSQPPIFYGQYQRIILTTPNKPQISSSHTKPIFQERSSRDVLGILPLPNVIEEEIKLIDIILEKLLQVENSSKLAVSEKIIEAMRLAINAEIALVESAKDDFSIQNKYLVSNNKQKNEEIIRNELLRQIYPAIIEDQEKLLESRFGLFKPLSGIKNKGKNILFIPLSTDFPREFLIFSGVNDQIIKNGDLMGQILIALYKATAEFTSLDLIHIENFLLDDIKSRFGFVPTTIYNKRYRNFYTQLQKIKFAFEPIVYLGKKYPQIDSWEALARDPETGKAPAGLFKAAKLWGNNFIKTIDLYCLSKSTRSFVELWNSDRKQSRKDSLSVNVFPNSLYQPEYFLELERITNTDDLLQGKGLVIEISEQLPIPYVKSKTDYAGSISYFEKILHDYHNKFDISFAIDDFGSGYSSIGRMIKLELNHIKIDREILHYKFPLDTIKYVIGTVRQLHRHQNTNIVVEGYDGESRASLADLYKIGIKYVQGHLLRRASETVHDLDDEEKKFIVDKLNQESSNDSSNYIEDAEIN